MIFDFASIIILVKELASYLELNRSSVSRMVECLERDGYTIRDLCPADKRGVYTVLADKGRVRLKSAQVDYENALEAALKEYDCDRLLSMEFI